MEQEKTFCIVEVDASVAKQLEKIAEDKKIPVSTVILNMIDPNELTKAGFRRAFYQHLRRSKYEPTYFHVRLPKNLWNVFKDLAKQSSLSLQRALGIHIEYVLKNFKEVKHEQK